MIEMTVILKVEMTVLDPATDAMAVEVADSFVRRTTITTKTMVVSAYMGNRNVRFILAAFTTGRIVC